MPAASAVPARQGLLVEEKVLAGVIAYFLVLKAVFVFFAYPISDEAYYWLWGQHLALSYYDHPPLHGWLLGLSSLVFGQSLFALRWMTIAALAVNLVVFAAAAKRIAGDDWRRVFLRSAAVYLASPLFGFFGSVAFHDYLMASLLIGSAYFFLVYFTDVEARGSGRLRDLLIAAVLLGLAGLTKYNAAYLGLAVAAIVVIRPKLRPLLVSWPIYVAGGIALLMQAPSIIWNAQHDWVSFTYQLGSRHGGEGFREISLPNMAAFTGELLLFASPFMFPMIFHFFLTRRPMETFERVGRTLAIVMFWSATAVCLYVANFSWVLWWWNITAFLVFFFFSGKYAGRAWLSLHVLFGAVVITFLTVSFAIVPLGQYVNGAATGETDYAYGWETIAARVRAEQQAHDAGFVATGRYQSASQLAWALGETDTVVAIARRRDTFDDWWDHEAHRGQDAIVIIDGLDLYDDWQTQFTTIEPLAPLTIVHMGVTLATYRLWVARDYQPMP